jgi:hypothetical protein
MVIYYHVQYVYKIISFLAGKPPIRPFSSLIPFADYQFPFQLVRMEFLVLQLFANVLVGGQSSESISLLAEVLILIY